MTKQILFGALGVLCLIFGIIFTRKMWINAEETLNNLPEHTVKIVDSCEYIQFNRYTTIHKGNCNNPEHKCEH